MNVDNNSMIEKLYQKSFNKILQVYEIFKDYFDEDKVDLQGVQTLESFKERLFSTKYNSVLSLAIITNNTQTWNETNEQDREIVKALCGSGALNTFIGSDTTVFKYIFPFLLEKYSIAGENFASIIIRFPEVRVTNENDKYVDIKELYARVKVNNNGCIVGTFGLLRADYPLSHIYADYAHSHIPGVTIDTGGYKSPCLGTGPINRTILSLVESCDLGLWMLFCRELDVYVTVESLSGVPHRRLENITGTKKLVRTSQTFSKIILNSGIQAYWNGLPVSEFKNFITHLLVNNIIKFNYNDGTYNLAMSYKDYIISLSNAFIDYINNHMDRTDENTDLFSLSYLETIELLKPFAIVNGEIYEFLMTEYTSGNYSRLNGKILIRFKDSNVCLNIYDDTAESEENVVYLLNFIFCESLLTKLIIYLNYASGKTQSGTPIDSSQKFFIL